MLCAIAADEQIADPADPATKNISRNRMSPPPLTVLIPG